VNAVGRAPWLARPLKLAGGIDGHRELLRFARERFTRWHPRRGTLPGTTWAEVVIRPEMVIMNDGGC
jgi:hypothetical protein